MAPKTNGLIEPTRSLAEILDAYGPWAVVAVLVIAFGVSLYTMRRDYVSRIRHLEGELENVNSWARDLVTGAKRKLNGSDEGGGDDAG